MACPGTPLVCAVAGAAGGDGENILHAALQAGGSVGTGSAGLRPDGMVFYTAIPRVQMGLFDAGRQPVPAAAPSLVQSPGNRNAASSQLQLISGNRNSAGNRSLSICSRTPV